MTTNQLEVNSLDQVYNQRNEREIYLRLKQISQELLVSFINYPKDIVRSKSDRVLCSYLFDLMPSIDQWNEFDNICQRLGKKIWFVTENIVDIELHKNFKNISIHSYPEILGITYLDSCHLGSENKLPSRLYNCFMQRCDSVRQSWFYFLWLEGLLDKGYVSYLLKQLKDYSELVNIDLFDFIHLNKGLDQLEKFQEAYRALRSRVPYRNFEENFDLITYINDSKYSVILETYAVDDDRYQWCFTEKVLRSLQSNTINLIFAQKHSAKCLENLGLKIDPINQQWDGDDWVIRQRKILETLKTDRVQFDAKSQKDRCDHNRSLLQSWKTKYQRSDFFDSLIKEIESS